MSVAAEIEKLQGERADHVGFNNQLDVMRRLREQQAARTDIDYAPIGLDRSRESITPRDLSRIGEY